MQFYRYKYKRKHKLRCSKIKLRNSPTSSMKIKGFNEEEFRKFHYKDLKKLKKPHKIIKFKLISKNCSYVASPWSNCNIWFAFTFISRCHAITGCVFQRQYIHSKAFFTSGTENEHFMHLTRYDDIWTFLYMLPI